MGDTLFRTVHSGKIVMSDKPLPPTFEEEADEKARDERADEFAAVGELVPGVLDAIRRGNPGRKRGVGANAKFIEANVGRLCVSTHNEETGKIDREYDFRSMVLSSGPVDTPAVTATVDAEGGTVSFTLSADETPDSSYHLPSDLVYGFVYDATLRRGSLVELGSRGDGGMKSFEIPDHWPATDLYVYAFARSRKGRKASATVALYPAG